MPSSKKFFKSAGLVERTCVEALRRDFRGLCSAASIERDARVESAAEFIMTSVTGSVGGVEVDSMEPSLSLFSDSAEERDSADVLTARRFRADVEALTMIEGSKGMGLSGCEVSHFGMETWRCVVITVGEGK